MPSSAEPGRRALHTRWLDTVDYHDAWALQRGLLRSPSNHLLLLEHPPVITLGVRADPRHVVGDPSSIGASVIAVDRGGDVTYHGPGQLVGYPILHLPGKRGGGMADTVAYVRSVEQLLIEALEELGVPGAFRRDRHPGVWVGTNMPRKIAAIGVRLVRGRSMHGFSFNVSPDLAHFECIVPCGITDGAVTSLRAEGSDACMEEAVTVVERLARARWGDERSTFAAVAPALPVGSAALVGAVVAVPLPTMGPAGSPPPARAAEPSARVQLRLDQAGVSSAVSLRERKPPWMRASARIDADGRIYVGSQDNFLYCIDPNGSVLWRYNVGQDVDSTVEIGADGTLYFGSDDGGVHALR